MDEDFLASRRSSVAKRIGDPSENPEPHHVSYDERIVAQSRADYLPAAFLKKTATHEQYLEFERILGEFWKLNELHAGERTREAEMILFWEGQLRPLQLQLLEWCRSYIPHRLERSDPRDQGNKYRQFHRLLGEMKQLIGRINAKGTLDYLFLHLYRPYSTWLLHEGSFKSNIQIRYVNENIEIFMPNTVVGGHCKHCIDLICELGFHRDTLRELLGRLTVIAKERYGHRSSRDLCADLAVMADDLKEMRPYLIHNFKPAKMIVEVAEGITLAWKWKTGFAIAEILGGHTEEATIKSAVSGRAAFAALVDEEGRLLDHFKPWIRAGEGNGKLLNENMLILRHFHEILLSFYGRIDFDRIRRRTIGWSRETNRPEGQEYDTEEGFSLSCQDLAERMVEGKTARPRRRIGMLRIEQLAGLLAQSFGCEVRQGKGSELNVYRPGGRLFTLGRHTKNPEVPSVVVRNLLKRLAIPEQDWLRVVYG